MDQIILCCIMSCLSINEKEEHQTLEILFCEYNSNIQFAFNSNQLGLKDQFGNEMKIIEYYNEVFLSEIQDMLTEKQDQLDDFLLTPVRITKLYSGSNIEKSLQRKKQLPGTFLFNPEKISNKKHSYRQNLIKQKMEMNEQKEEDELDVPSPTFGMTRTVTFADLSTK